MKYILNIIFLGVAIFLGYLLYKNITDPIKIQAQIVEQVSDSACKLGEIKKVQAAYKTNNGKYAKSFDTLNAFIMNDSFTVKRVMGDPDDSTKQTTVDIQMVAIKDSLFKNKDNNYIKNLNAIPNVNGRFTLDAGTIEQNRVTVHVFEVKAPYATILKGINEKYYDPHIHVGQDMVLGSMYKATTSGNWPSKYGGDCN